MPSPISAHPKALVFNKCTGCLIGHLQYPEMYFTWSANTHYDIAILKVHGMISNIKSAYLEQGTSLPYEAKNNI